MRHSLLLLSLALAALAVPAAAAAYPWPIKPFDRQHPIRGFFGDPRTVYAGGVDDNGISGPGSFSFHQGVDIVAPDGTPVYAIANGRVRYIGAATLNLVTARSVTFQYFHVVAVVGEGQHVVARQTVIGYVQAPYGHVHISEIRKGHAVNPLQRGHLTPYFDSTRPTVREHSAREPRRRRPGPDGALRPRADRRRRLRHAAAARHREVRRASGRAGARDVADHARLEGRRADARRSRLPPPRFRRTRTSGTSTRAARTRTTPASATSSSRRRPAATCSCSRRDSTRGTLRNGTYTIHVRATDVRGNTSASTKTFSVANSGAGCRGSLASAEAPPRRRISSGTATSG